MNFDQQIKENETIRNHEGEKAYAMTPEMELYSAVTTTMMDDTFYEEQDARVERIAELVAKVDPLFTAQLAVYTRTQMNLRSAPLLLITELARIHNGDSLVSRTIAKTLLRADEISELLSCYQLRNPKTTDKKLNKLSQQIKEGLQIAFNRFDEYQFAKYDRSSRQVKFRDALFLVHPKAKDESQQAIFDKIVSGKLETPYTWETELSALGKQQFATPEEKEKAVTAKWEELIDSGRLGYMAMLRNLRNFLIHHVSDRHLEMVCERIADEKSVLESKQLPFRFLSAYRQIVENDVISEEALPVADHLLDALERAVQISVGNIRGFSPDTRVLMACDVSGSMCIGVSDKSSVQLFDVGLLLSMLFKSTCREVTVGIFGDTWKTIRLQNSNVLARTLQMREREGEVGYATNGYAVIEWLLEKQRIVDKVLMFTDCQMWDNTPEGKHIRQSWRKYKALAPNAQLYLFDLAGYGHSPFKEQELNVRIISGWSDKVFDMLHALENGASVLEEIRAIEI